MKNYSHWKNFLKNFIHDQARDSVKGDGPIFHWHNFVKYGNSLIIYWFGGVRVMSVF